MMARPPGAAETSLNPTQKFIVDTLNLLKDGNYVFPEEIESQIKQRSNGVSAGFALKSDPTLNIRILTIRMNPKVRLNITIKPDSGLITGKWFSNNEGYELKGADKMGYDLVLGLVVDKMNLSKHAANAEEITQLTFSSLLPDVQDGVYKSPGIPVQEKNTSTIITIQTNPDSSRTLKFEASGSYKIELKITADHKVMKLEVAVGDSMSEIVKGSEKGVLVLSGILRILNSTDFSVPKLS